MMYFHRVSELPYAVTIEMTDARNAANIEKKFPKESKEYADKEKALMEIPDVKKLSELVEFAKKALTIAALPFRTEDSTIPEVCAYVIIGFSVTKKMAVLHLDKR